MGAHSSTLAPCNSHTWHRFRHQAWYWWSVGWKQGRLGSGIWKVKSWGKMGRCLQKVKAYGSHHDKQNCDSELSFTSISVASSPRHKRRPGTTASRANTRDGWAVVPSRRLGPTSDIHARLGTTWGRRRRRARCLDKTGWASRTVEGDRTGYLIHYILSASNTAHVHRSRWMHLSKELYQSAGLVSCCLRRTLCTSIVVHQRHLDQHVVESRCSRVLPIAAWNGTHVGQRRRRHVALELLQLRYRVRLYSTPGVT